MSDYDETDRPDTWWKCSNCGEEFSDHDMLANSELSLCLYCGDLRYREENKGNYAGETRSDGSD